jgi:hypothetical protein
MADLNGDPPPDCLEKDAYLIVQIARNLVTSATADGGSRDGATDDDDATLSGVGRPAAVRGSARRDVPNRQPSADCRSTTLSSLIRAAALRSSARRDATAASRRQVAELVARRARAGDGERGSDTRTYNGFLSLTHLHPCCCNLGNWDQLARCPGSWHTRK